MKNVLLLNTLYQPNTGGIENSLRHLAAEFENEGFKTLIVSSTVNNETATRLPEHEIIHGIKVRRYRALAVFPRPLFRLFSCARLLTKLRREQPFDIVVSRCAETTVSAYLAGFRQIIYIPGSVSKIETMTNRVAAKLTRSLSLAFSNTIQKIACRVASERTLVFSQLMADGLASVVPGLKAQLVSPGVDMGRFYPVAQDSKDSLRRSLGIPVEKKVFLCLGRLVPQKNMELAVQMAAHFEADEHLVIVGDGPSKAKLQALVNELGVADQVSFHPSTACPEQFYQASDAFLMLSEYEPFGQTLLEATASGAVVIALSRETGVATATEEIYQGYPALARFARSLAADELIKVARQAALHPDPDFSEQRRSFLLRHSWQSMCNKLIALRECSEHQNASAT